jgi:trk system potassium uptake protein TrkH
MTGPSPGTRAAGFPLLDALFQSVSSRTAGFNTVDIAALSVPSLMILVPLMFIGGSPGSCAGGIKTTSLCVWLARVRARLSGQRDVALWDRRVPQDVVRRAALVAALAVLWNSMGVMVLAMSENVGSGIRFEQIIFEQVSAFGTVGLSTGITSGLSAVGKLWIVASMFAGRLGPLTVALAVLQAQRSPRVAYPEERVLIG